MHRKTIPCLYAQKKDTRTQKFADLKELYATTKSQNIKSLLYMAENFILFDHGTVDDIIRRIKQVVNPTMEEKTFFPKLKAVIRMKK